MTFGTVSVGFPLPTKTKWRHEHRLLGCAAAVRLRSLGRGLGHPFV